MGNSHGEVRRILAGVLACFFVSGATGLIYEVLWLRMFGLVFGHTIFAITTVLAALLPIGLTPNAPMDSVAGWAGPISQSL